MRLLCISWYASSASRRLSYSTKANLFALASICLDDRTGRTICWQRFLEREYRSVSSDHNFRKMNVRVDYDDCLWSRKGVGRGRDGTAVVSAWTTSSITGRDMRRVREGGRHDRSNKIVVQDIIVWMPKENRFETYRSNS